MIESRRLILLPASETHLRGELAGRDAFADAIGVAVPASWPPDLYDEHAVRYTLRLMADHPGSSAWGSYYVVRKAAAGTPATVVGVGGFKGGPDADGAVEIGYSIVPEFQRQGLATEAVQRWVAFALASPDVRVVVAQTLPHLVPSIGVLVKAGFQFAGAGQDPGVPQDEPVVRYERRRSVVRRSIALVSLVVREYDEAIAFFVGTLGFELIEDTYVPEQDKRWVIVGPPGATESRLLLARASTEDQRARVGSQTGGRVFLFLHTDNFWRDFDAYRAKGIEFVREPRHEPYGTVAVFKDLYGNLWDLIQPSVSGDRPT